MIVDNHPVDPDTKERFSLSSRVTVRNYGTKLFDVCGVVRIMKIQKTVVNKTKAVLLNTIC